MVPNPITKHNMETTVNMILVFGVMEYYCYNFFSEFANPLKLLVRPARFELAAYGFVVRRSIRAELRAHIKFIRNSISS